MEQVYAPQTVAGSNITVTSSASTLPALVDVASAGSSALWPEDPTALDICPEDGDIRYTINSQLTPTASIGYLLKQGTHKQFRGLHVKTLKLIRVGSADVKCSVMVGKVGDDETDSFGVSSSYPGGLSLAGCGELQGSTSALQNPSLVCKFVKYKASAANAGNVYLGGAGVTKPDATTDVTTGMQLAPGDDSGWIPVTNTNLFYRICDNAADALTFIALV